MVNSLRVLTLRPILTPLIVTSITANPGQWNFHPNRNRTLVNPTFLAGAINGLPQDVIDVADRAYFVIRCTPIANQPNNHNPNIPPVRFGNREVIDIVLEEFELLVGINQVNNAAFAGQPTGWMTVNNLYIPPLV